MDTSRDNQIPSDLIDAIRRRECVLFVGAGLSTGAGLPSGKRLAELMVKAIGYPYADDSLEKIAQAFEEDKGKRELGRFLKKAIADKARAYSKGHRIVAELVKQGMFDYIFTTNYDHLIEQALYDVGCGVTSICCDDDIARVSRDKVQLVKLHGDIDNWESIVITEDDYFDFFEKKSGLKDILKASLLQRHFLFVGYALEDVNFGYIYREVLRSLGKFQRHSYAVQLKPKSFSDQQWQRFWVSKWRERNVRVIDMDAEKFLAELENALRPGFRRPGLRIAHVVFSEGSYGGIQTYVDTITRHSKHRHDTWEVFRGFPPYPSEYVHFYAGCKQVVEELELDSKVHDAFDRTIRDFTGFVAALELSPAQYDEFTKIKRTAEDELDSLAKYDVVHAHFLLPAFFAQRRGFNTILTSHSLLSEDFRYEDSGVDSVNSCRNDEQQFYPQLHNTIVLSQAHKKEVNGCGGMAVVMGPIFDRFEFDNSSVRRMSTSDARTRLSLPEKLTILFLGRPARRKGLEVLIEAVNLIDRDDIQLVIVGKGFQMSVNDRPIVWYAGPRMLWSIEVKRPHEVVVNGDPDRTEIPYYYKASDIIICPSLYEPLGYVVLEAMAAERPIIASETGGIPEIVQDGVTGLLFEPGNAAELREKILLLMENDDLRERLGSNGYEFVRRNFDVKRQAEELDCLYEVVAAGESTIGS